VKNNIGRKEHNLEANLALVKLYKFYPQQSNTQILSLILAQSLMYPQEQAFNLVLFMLSEKVLKEDKIVKLSALSEALDNAQFAEFWNKVKDARDLVSNVPGFEDEIREFVISVLSRTYKTVAKDLVSAALGLSDPTSYLEGKGHKVHGSDVIFSSAEVLEPQIASRENIPYSQLTGLLNSLN